MNNASRLKELFLKLRFGTDLMATLTIPSKKPSMEECPLIEKQLLITSFTWVCF